MVAKSEVLRCGADVLEDIVMKLSPLLLDTLLKDHAAGTETNPANIFWATDDYEELGNAYKFASPILPELITGKNGHVIMPRVLKMREKQIERIRNKAEVFTPSWLCNYQNNLIDAAWFNRTDVFNCQHSNRIWQVNEEKIKFPEGKNWQDYVLEKRLEITCGEAPYTASRYDSTTGQEIPVSRRIGFLDRKLRIVSENTEKTDEWLTWAQAAYQNVYGYEWQGDNLLIARENLLLTFLDYYREKFGADPKLHSLQSIANVISWNLWQMDGLKGVIPRSCKPIVQRQQDFFMEQLSEVPCEGCLIGNKFRHTGTYCMVMDWEHGKSMRYIDL